MNQSKDQELIADKAYHALYFQIKQLVSVACKISPFITLIIIIIAIIVIKVLKGEIL